MASLDELQRDAAKWLVNRLRNARQGEPVLAHVSGTCGAGKSTIMRHVAAELPSVGRFPLIIEAVAGELDWGRWPCSVPWINCEKAKLRTS
jgi:ABC-type hemin transport system ATPase subunit